MLVKVKPIDREKWHGKSGKENFDQPITVEALYDPEVGGYATGLTEDEKKEYEEKTGYDLSNKFHSEKPHEFWSSATSRVKLPNHTVVFDIEKPLEFIKVQMLKASVLVANSVSEISQFPDATHVIYDEEEDTKNKASKIQEKNKARKLSFKLSKDEKNNIVQILAEKSVRNRSEDFVDVEIDKLVEDKTTEFLRLAQMDKNEVYTRAAILEALHRNILTKEGSSIYYMGDKLGFDLEDTMKYFLSPQNQKIKGAILEKLNSK